MVKFGTVEQFARDLEAQFGPFKLELASCGRAFTAKLTGEKYGQKFTGCFTDNTAYKALVGAVRALEAEYALGTTPPPAYRPFYETKEQKNRKAMVDVAGSLEEAAAQLRKVAGNL